MAAMTPDRIVMVAALRSSSNASHTFASSELSSVLLFSVCRRSSRGAAAVVRGLAPPLLRRALGKRTLHPRTTLRLASIFSIVGEGETNVREEHEPPRSTHRSSYAAGTRAGGRGGSAGRAGRPRLPRAGVPQRVRGPGERLYPAGAVAAHHSPTRSAYWWRMPTWWARCWASSPRRRGAAARQRQLNRTPEGDAQGLECRADAIP